MEKTDEKIQEMLNGGMEYIQYPIRLEKIKKLLETLEEEYTIFEDDINAKIDYALQNAGKFSAAKIANHLRLDIETTLVYLNERVSQGKLVRLEDVKEIACNECGSVIINQFAVCPNCKKSDFKKGALIEHYDCGNISMEQDYVDDKCPNCKKEITALGVDYRKMDNHNECNECSEKFPEPLMEYSCISCNNKFQINQVKWQTSPAFKS